MWKQQMLKLNIGDIFVAYISGRGFVGIGKIIEKAIPSDEFIVDGKSLTILISTNDKNSAFGGKIINDEDYREFVCKVEWINCVNKENAIPKNKDIHIPIKAIEPLNNQNTLKFLEEKFKVSFNKLIEIA